MAKFLITTIQVNLVPNPGEGNINSPELSLLKILDNILLESKIIPKLAIINANNSLMRFIPATILIFTIISTAHVVVAPGMNSSHSVKELSFLASLQTVKLAIQFSLCKPAVIYTSYQTGV